MQVLIILKGRFNLSFFMDKNSMVILKLKMSIDTIYNKWYNFIVH